jgi:hypothetical protein
MLLSVLHMSVLLLSVLLLSVLLLSVLLLSVLLMHVSALSLMAMLLMHVSLVRLSLTAVLMMLAMLLMLPMVQKRLLLGDCMRVSRLPRPQQVKVAEVVCGRGRPVAGIVASMTGNSLLRLSRAVVAVAVHVCLWEGG